MWQDVTALPSLFPIVIYLFNPSTFFSLSKTCCTPRTLCTLDIYAKSRILARQVPLFPQQEALYKNQEPIFENYLHLIFQR
jgi:hypothetical protein